MSTFAQLGRTFHVTLAGETGLLGVARTCCRTEELNGCSCVVGNGLWLVTSVDGTAGIVEIIEVQRVRVIHDQKKSGLRRAIPDRSRRRLNKCLDLLLV